MVNKGRAYYFLTYRGPLMKYASSCPVKTVDACGYCLPVKWWGLVLPSIFWAIFLPVWNSDLHMEFYHLFLLRKKAQAPSPNNELFVTRINELSVVLWPCYSGYLLESWDTVLQCQMTLSLGEANLQLLTFCGGKFMDESNYASKRWSLMKIFLALLV